MQDAARGRSKYHVHTPYTCSTQSRNVTAESSDKLTERCSNNGKRQRATVYGYGTDCHEVRIKILRQPAHLTCCTFPRSRVDLTGVQSSARHLLTSPYPKIL